MTTADDKTKLENADGRPQAAPESVEKLSLKDRLQMQTGATQIAKIEEHRTNKSSGSMNPENFQSIEITYSDNQVVSRHNPLKEKDLMKEEDQVKAKHPAAASDWQLQNRECVQAASEAAIEPPPRQTGGLEVKEPPHSNQAAEATQHRAALVKQLVYPGVSSEFRQRVDHFCRSIPAKLQPELKQKGVQVAVFANAGQLPEDIRQKQARRHGSDETTGHLPMFYMRNYKTLVFVEHPYLTKTEQTAKDGFDNTLDANRKRGVQVYGELAKFDPKLLSYAPIERDGWHELGHAIEHSLLKDFAQSPQFQQAFMHDRQSVPDDLKPHLRYFMQGEQEPTGNNFMAAKQELFAELFAIMHTPQSQHTNRDNLLLLHFKEVAALMKQQPLLKP